VQEIIRETAWSGQEKSCWHRAWQGIPFWWGDPWGASGKSRIL